MLNLLTKSLAVEIDNFITFVRQTIQEKEMLCFTKSAFVQCRKKIKPEVFKFLSDSLIQEFYTDNETAVKHWQGFRLLAVDGSRLTLPDVKELETIYGRTKNQSDTGVVQARFSVLHDVLNRFTLDGCLSPLSVGEGTLALRHLDYATIGDLIIYDRGYPSFELIYEHFNRRIDFLIRVKSDFSNVIKSFVNSELMTDTVKMYPGKNTLSGKPYSKESFVEVRLVRVKLSSGEEEILITSLIDREKYPNRLFKDLYFLRWGVETFYDEIKNKVKMECFTGYSAHSILQDFYATLFVSNVQSLILTELNEELTEESKSKGLKYQYKVNNNVSYGLLRNRIITLFFSSKDMTEVVGELKKLFREHIVPIRPGRKFERNTGKYRKREKPKVFKNNRNAV